VRSQIQLGGFIEAVTGAELADALSGVHGKLDDLAGRGDPQPVYQTLVPNNMGGQAMPATGAGVLVFDGPLPGQLFQVRQLVWAVTDDRTAVAGGFASAYVATSGAQMLGQLFLTGKTIPGSYEFTRGSVIVQPGEDVIMLFYGAAAAAQLVGVVRVEIWPQAQSERMRWP
jgi:hypothetical protein